MLQALPVLGLLALLQELLELVPVQLALEPEPLGLGLELELPLVLVLPVQLDPAELLCPAEVLGLLVRLLLRPYSLNLL